MILQSLTLGWLVTLAYIGKIGFGISRHLRPNRSKHIGLPNQRRWHGAGFGLRRILQALWSYTTFRLAMLLVFAVAVASRMSWIVVRRSEPLRKYKILGGEMCPEALESIPTTIYRPGIVVGDSVTGETIKGDGPYFIMNLLMKLPKWVPMVDIGASQATVNIVPVDFLVNAMVEIGRREETIGQVYNLPTQSQLAKTSFVGSSIIWACAGCRDGAELYSGN